MPITTRQGAVGALALILPALLALPAAATAGDATSGAAGGAAGNGAAGVRAAFLVDTTSDLVDLTPGDTICGDGTAGTCSLRAAIQETNALPGADTVTLPAGTYTLSIEGTKEDASATGDLDVTDELTIAGAGAATTTIDAAGIDRVLHTPGTALAPGVMLRVSDVTISGGSAVYEDLLGNSVWRVAGGGIAATGPIEVTSTTITGNHADGSTLFFGSGGGIHARGAATISESTITANTAGGGDSAGAGIFLEGGGSIDASTVSSNTLSDLTAGFSFTPSGGGGAAVTGFGASYTITDSTFDGNQVIGDDTTYGGGIYVGVRADIIGVTATNNTAGSGGGVGGLNMTLEDVLLTGNTATRAGGGVASQSQIRSTLRDSTVSGNTAAIGGGAATFGVNGSDGNLLIVRSTISGNDAANGGGVASADPNGVLRVLSSTVSGNDATQRGGGIASTGNTSTLDVDLSTISGNTAAVGAGGVAVETGTTATITTSTITANSAPGAGGVSVEGGATTRRTIIGGQTSGADCDGAGSHTSDGNNLDSDASCPFALTSDVTGDPNLAPLANNGGTTKTHKPQRPSLVFDRGGLSCGAEDQRLLARPQNLACEIGAVEVTPWQQFSDIPSTQGFSREIWWLYANGMTNGYANGTYGPGDSITRQALVAMLWREAGSPPVTGVAPFSDVPPSHPFHDAITWSANTGLVGGYVDGTFKPGNAVSRQAFSALLWRQAGSPNPAGPSPFSDVPQTHLFRKAIVWAYEERLTLGYPDLTFRPAVTVSRQALAAFLARFRTGAL